jgi:hypothetical protein
MLWDEIWFSFALYNSNTTLKYILNKLPIFSIPKLIYKHASSVSIAFYFSLHFVEIFCKHTCTFSAQFSILLSAPRHFTNTRVPLYPTSTFLTFLRYSIRTRVPFLLSFFYVYSSLPAVFYENTFLFLAPFPKFLTFPSCGMSTRESFLLLLA